MQNKKAITENSKSNVFIYVLALTETILFFTWYKTCTTNFFRFFQYQNIYFSLMVVITPVGIGKKRIFCLEFCGHPVKKNTFSGSAKTLIKTLDFEF